MPPAEVDSGGPVIGNPLGTQTQPLQTLVAWLTDTHLHETLSASLRRHAEPHVTVF
jgi:hypothetical protein